MMTNLNKKLIGIIVIAFMLGGLVIITPSTNIVDAATCGAPNTCYGHRINPTPGGCGCYTNEEGCSGGCPGGNPPSNPPACNKSSPGIPTNQAPLQGSVNNPKPITLRWANAGWGAGCPNTNYNKIFYRPKTQACNIPTGYQETAYFAATTSRVFNAELAWGTTYCWYVEQFNRAFSTFSTPSEFTTSRPPVYTGGGFTGIDVCGNQSSGRTAAGVTNPIEWTASFSNPEPTNVMEWFVLAMVPTTGTYGVNTDTADWTTTYTKAMQSGSFVFAINKPGTAAATYKSLNLPASWTTAPPSATSLTSGNGRAVLMDLNSGTSLVTNGANATAKYRIGFNNTFPSGTYNIYVITLTSNPALGTLMFSNDATAANPYFMKKSGTWRVDMTPPSATITTPTLNALDGTFSMTWSVSDNIGVTGVRSYIYSDVNGAVIRDNTIGTDITTQIGELSYPTASNAGIGLGNLGNHVYKDQSPDTGAAYSFKLHARDAACNFAETSVKKDPLTPWLLGANGDISGRGGIAKTKIPVISNFTIPFTTTTGESFFSQYGSISGTDTNALGKISKFAENINNYLDDAIIPPHSGDTAWYDYLLDKVIKNEKTKIVPQGSKTISSTISSGLGGSPDIKMGVEITGDLNINTNTACDITGLIFVRGNLNINPDLTVTNRQPASPANLQIYNGCVFIVKGDVNVGLGTAKTNLPTSSTNLASYDIINALILTDGFFNVPVDNRGAGRKGDGLYVNGGVVAQNTVNGSATTIRRDISQEGNNLQPSTFFNLDARYKLMFSEDFASRDYEIREYGL